MKMSYGNTGILRETKNGEDIPVMTIDVEDCSMRKIWYLVLSEQCGLGRGTQKEKIVKWIIDNLDSENRVIVTQRRLADILGISVVTVSETMSILQKGENPFLVRLFSGVYEINPKLAYKGSENSKIAFIYQVKEEEEEEITENEEDEDNEEATEIIPEEEEDEESENNEEQAEC